MQNKKVALIGNPNAGKTTIFNHLTKQNQRVANWPGMTVEQKTGTLKVNGQNFSIIDLPGCYALNNNSQLDEKITANYLLEQDTDIIINVINSCKLSQHLYLTMQLIETEIPVIVVLNFIDLLKSEIDIDQLEKELGCPVLAVSARKKFGLHKIEAQLMQTKPKLYQYYPMIEKNIKALMQFLPLQYQKPWIAIQLLENSLKIELSQTCNKKIQQQKISIADAFDDEAEIIIADLRYNLIQKIINKVASNNPRSKSADSSYKIDKILLHPWLGLPIFLLIMYFMFAICLTFGTSIQEPFAESCNLLLIQWPISKLQHMLDPWLINILVNGVGVAITTTLSFIPPLFLLFITLSILEQSGYMARAAFITDRLMSLIKLPGRAFVSLLIGFGCNVPAIMSTRTLQSHEDRVLTSMMTPFMSCTARLALYVVLVQAFFKEHGSQIIFAIYMTGIIAAVITGFILKKVFLSKSTQPLILELPDYLVPSIKQITFESCKRIKRFIARTFKFMLFACCFLALLNTIHINSKLSLIQQIAQKAAFILKPMGITSDSWITVVALIMGIIAKEVMVGIFHTLGQTSYVIPNNVTLSKLVVIWQSWWHGADTSAAKTLANIQQLFHDPKAVVAFLLFSCLYLPCFSTLAALKKECGAKWSWLASIWSFILAYGTATLYYNLS